MTDSNKQLEPGDLAIITKSTKGKSVGKIVECVCIAGTDPNFGVIWTVTAQGGGLELHHTGDVEPYAQVPQDWLKKIPKDPLPDNEDLFEAPRIEELVD